MQFATEVARGTRRCAQAGAEDLAHLRDNLGKRMRELRGAADRRFKATDKYVHGHPWKSMGVAAGLAAFVGMVTARGLRKRH